MNSYQAHILDKYQNPLHHQKPDRFTHTFRLENLSCGDIVTMYLTIENDVVTEINFEAEGCVISLAAAEIYSDTFVGKSTQEITAKTWEDIEGILQIPLTANRYKCAHMPLQAIQEAIQRQPD